MSERFSTKKYEESYGPANEWLQKNAPDFVTECVDELVAYIEYLKETVQIRDNLVKDICIAHGVDPLKLFEDDNNDDEDCHKQ